MTAERTDRLTPEASLSELLLPWYRANCRALPWRQDVTPYRVWISEIMLQQTRVEAVKGYFERFIAVLPSLPELAAVPDETLLKLWQGLGYYSRARNLKRAAVEAVSRFSGELPDDFDALLTLPGIGRYTAGAIASIAFGRRTPAVDGNVLRVYARLTGDERDISEESTKAAFAEAIRSEMPEESGRYGNPVTGRNDCGDFTQGLIELGATVCVPNGVPLCDGCPLREICVARREGSTELLPVKRKKAARRIEERTVLLLTYGDRLGLVRRPDTGLLAGLFEPLSIEGRVDADTVRAHLASIGFDPDTVGEITPVGAAKHIFTHVEWHMTGYRVALRSTEHHAEVILPTLSEIAESYAVPSAFRYFLRIAAEGREG